MGKLNDRQDSSETIESFTTKFTRTSCTCSHKFRNGCPLLTAVRSWRQIQTNQTSFGMVSENLSTSPIGGVTMIDVNKKSSERNF